MCIGARVHLSGRVIVWGSVQKRVILGGSSVGLSGAPTGGVAVGVTVGSFGWRLPWGPTIDTEKKADVSTTTTSIEKYRYAFFILSPLTLECEGTLFHIV